MRWLLAWFLLVPMLHAEIIPAERRVDWIPGVTVGLLEPLPTSHTNIVLNAHTDYGLDNTGVTNCDAILASAISQIVAVGAANHTLYFPAGHYKIGSQINLLTDIKLLGDGPGRTFINQVSNNVCFIMSDSPSGGYVNVLGGTTKGSTNIQVDDATYLAAGLLTGIASLPNTNDIHIMSAGLGTFITNSVGSFGGQLVAWNYIESFVGTNVHLRVPLPYDMTNRVSLLLRVTQPNRRIILDGITFTTTNPPTAEASTSGDMFSIAHARNFLITNCEFAYTPSHFGSIGSEVVGGLITHCIFRDGRGAGSGTGGVRTGGNNILFENNAFINTPGFEVNGGVGCAWFGNYFRSPYVSLFDIFMHSSHPWMMLFEANHFQNGILTDGYHGSCSHFTIFRNYAPGYGAGALPELGPSGYAALKFCRWSRQMNVVGNVLGNDSTTWKYQISATNPTSFPAIFWFGMPNIGNQGYAGVHTNDVNWDNPGTNYFDSGSGLIRAYTPKVFVSGQGPTNVLRGFDFSDIVIYAGQMRIVFRSASNTNEYSTRYTNGVEIVTATATDGTSMTLDKHVTVLPGDTLYVIGNGGWQEIAENDLPTHLITGNYDYSGVPQIRWNAAGAQNLPSGILYPERTSLVNPTNGTVGTLDSMQWSNWVYTAAVTPATPGALRVKNARITWR